MKTNEALFSSRCSEWETPQIVFNELHHEFNFDIDVCANKENSKCIYYMDKEDSCLNRSWLLFNKDPCACFMNPPYGREIGKFVKKAYEESLKGNLVVCLLPARTDTKWFHEYCVKGEIRFIKGRLKFSKSKDNAPFPSMVVIFRNKK